MISNAALILILLFVSTCQSITIVAIFAGRERYLKVLKKYLDTLLRLKLIDEVHLWDYTRSDADSSYIRSVIKEPYILKTFNKTVDTGLYSYGGPWGYFYEFYGKSEGYNNNDIVIKCDDDIVYIDVKQFPHYLKAVRDDGLYFANIINNDVCAHIQTKFGIYNLMPFSEIPYKDSLEFGSAHPLSGRFNDSRPGWWTNHNKAKAIHNLFLRNPHKFSINSTEVIEWGSRISINFFSGRVSVIRKYFNLFLANDNEDEGFMSGTVLTLVNSTNRIVPFFNVVHFSFGLQSRELLDKLFLKQYYELYKTVHRGFTQGQ